jgi:signal transduction histidine kinase
MIEGRNRVRDLRLSEGSSDLRAMIEALVANTSFEPPIAVRIVLEGKPQPLEPLVAAEIGRIVGEALLNVARHARAGAAEIEICFDAHQLVLAIRDNGVGLDPEVVRIGQKDGHFGLVGMRERAERIGGTLTIESAIGKGTDLTLTTPAGLAYAGSVVSRWRRRIGLAMQT